MVSAGLEVEWMEVEKCFSALTGGDWTMVVIDLESTNDGGAVTEEEPSAKEELFPSGRETRSSPNWLVDFPLAF